MQLVYCACALAALIRMMRTPFAAFKCLLVTTILSRSLWTPSMSSHWWTRWLLIFEPTVTLLMLASVLEVGYFATVRMFPSERRSLLVMSALAACIWAIAMFWMPNTPLGIIVGVRLCVQSGIAAMALFGALYLWWRGEPPASLTRDHGITLVALLCSGAAVGTWDRFITTGYWWWIANTVFWCSQSTCMVHWCFISRVRSAPPRAPDSLTARAGC